MNKQGPGKIGWTDWTLNPIRGLCPMDCKLSDGRSYCYMRPLHRRFKWNHRVMLYPAILQQIYIRQKPMKCFTCSGFEIFHPIVKPEWRDEIFRVISDNPQHTFQILTKMPENIDRPMPKNVHLGISLPDTTNWVGRVVALKEAIAKRKFISFEPLLTPYFGVRGIPSFVDQVIIGRLTQHGKKYDPDSLTIREMIQYARENNTAIFLKDNLIPIMGKDFVGKHKEFPGEK